MTNLFNTAAKTALVGAMSLAALAAAAAPAAARPHHDTNGVTSCAAPGRSQETGAVVGAILGAVVGHQIQHNDTGTGVGAVVGGVVGAGVGCQIQHDRQDARDDAWAYGYGYDGVAPARYQPMNRWMVADQRTAIRQAPSQGADRLGTLHDGERFQAVGMVEGGRWILVADSGRLVGYVRGDAVEMVPTGYAYNGY
jgi:hypothetical protein